jgi:hypothetical protein
MFTEEVIAKVKKERGDVYFGELSFFDKSDTPHSVEFLFRKPVVSDIEVYQKAATKSPSVAQENLLRSVIVYPESATVIDQIRDYPSAVAGFVESEISPFFGANVRSASRKV